MCNFKLIIFVIYFAIWPASCVPHRGKSKNIQTVHRTGVAVAVDNLIKEYEMEHFKFYEKEIEDDYLGWPDLEDKNLSNYCKKFLQISIPDRNTSDAAGFTIKKTLRYEKMNIKNTSDVVIVQCTVMRNRYNLSYYITRGPTPNCVYALKSVRNFNYIILNIINKFCDFEDRQLSNNLLKRKREEFTFKSNFETGQPVASNEYLLEYELEHQELLQQEGNYGDHLKWPELDKKNLFKYCRKYLQQIISARNTDDATGIKIKKALHYVRDNTSTTTDVIIVQCNIINEKQQLAYYITRAPKPNCVYALKSTGNWNNLIFTINNKHCDFENKQLLHRSLLWKGKKIVYKIHQNTGQPIAKDEYLLEYELEHRELHKREGNKENHMTWLHAIVHPNLDSYCYQYVRECAPNRFREGITGLWKTELMYYQNLHTKLEIKVMTVTCRTSDLCTRNYHITRAPEKNCVYALLRKGHRPKNPLIIIFKHCDFEDRNDQFTVSKDHDIIDRKPFSITEENEQILANFENLNDQRTAASQGHDVLDKNEIPKTEMKEETFDAFQPLDLFPKV